MADFRFYPQFLRKFQNSFKYQLTPEPEQTDIDQPPKMKAAIIFLVCAFATINAQVVNPTWGMGSGSWGNQMLNPLNPLNPLWRTQGHAQGPGVMQTSQLNSMTYPVWKSHPVFRMAYVPSERAAEGASAGTVGGGGQGILNLPKVLPGQEVLTHMALAAQSAKPYFDTIADFLYSPEQLQLRGRQAVVSSPVYLQPGNGMSGMNGMTGVNGMNVMRAVYNPDDCPQEARFLRDMSEWVY